MKPIRSCVATLAVVVAGSVLDVQAAPQSLPFNPPVVHRGYNPNSPLWKPQQHSGKRQSNSGVFDDAARRSFKALHPFLLHEAQPVPAGRSTPRSKPKVRKVIKRSRKL